MPPPASSSSFVVEQVPFAQASSPSASQSAEAGPSADAGLFELPAERHAAKLLSFDLFTSMDVRSSFSFEIQFSHIQRVLESSVLLSLAPNFLKDSEARPFLFLGRAFSPGSHKSSP